MSWNTLPLELYPTTRSSIRVVNDVRDHLRGAWVTDEDFFAKFFPLDDEIRDTYQRSKKGLYSGHKWSKIASNPTAVSRLYTPLTNLLNGILQVFGLTDDGLGNRRRALNTSRSRVRPGLDFPVWPPLLLAGSGSHFICSDETSPLKDYTLGISALEVRLESQDETEARDRLVSHMQQLISYQCHRRYAFGLVISQYTLTVHMFDRSGVVSSPSLSYHENPEQFCAIVAGLASMESERLGLDPSMFRDKRGFVVRTTEVEGKRKPKNIDYILDLNLYYSYDLMGRGTTCFAAHKETAPKTIYVIKDSWIAKEELEGKESEASLVAHARNLGVSNGIPVVNHNEEVRIKGRTGRVGLDSIINNRQDRSLDPPYVERVHTRLVMLPYGKPLDRFSNRTELLAAYHDALQAHRSLYEVAGILHRDIKPGNILINPYGDEGNRGILIDFDHAIKISDKSPYSTQRKIGTYIFMSRNALRGTEPHTYLDDLESFYYVLVYIAVAYSAPHSHKGLPHSLDQWDGPVAAQAKTGFIMEKLTDEVEPWFGRPFQKLLEQLHSIFTELYRAQALAGWNKQPPPVVNGAEVYDAILSHVRVAMDDVIQAELVGRLGDTPRGPDYLQLYDNTEKPALVDVGRKDKDQASVAFSWLSRQLIKRKHVKAVTTMAANRSRRSGANYKMNKADNMQQSHNAARRPQRLTASRK